MLTTRGRVLLRHVSTWIYSGLILLILLHIGTAYVFSIDIEYESVHIMETNHDIIDSSINDVYIYDYPGKHRQIIPDSQEKPEELTDNETIQQPNYIIEHEAKELVHYLMQHTVISPQALTLGTYRLMPLFLEIFDDVHTSVMPLRSVEVIETQDRWWNINTYQGPKWINLDDEIIPMFDDIAARLHGYGNSISLFYKNLETGFSYAHNPSRVFFSASISKAMHAFYTYIAAERGYIDLYTTHTYRATDFWGGTGIIRFMQVGAEFTTRELLYYSIRHSDNIAFRMLYRYMNNIDFSYRDFIIEQGFNPRFVLGDYEQNASAEDIGLWMYAMHRYFESESRYGHYFHEDMRNVELYSHPYFTRGTVFGGNEEINVHLLHSDYQMAKKYGWASHAFNVMGVVYAQSPYILIILSNMASGAHDLFEEISWIFQELNAKYFYFSSRNDTCYDGVVQLQH